MQQKNPAPAPAFPHVLPILSCGEPDSLWQGPRRHGKLAPFAPPPSAVPCLRRAAAVEDYGEQAEHEVEAGDGGEGWITADRSSRPGAADEAGVTTTNDDGFEEVPSIEEASGGSGGGAAAEAVSEAAGGSVGVGGLSGAGEEEEDVPDIDELELEEEEEEDEVGCSRGAAAVWVSCLWGQPAWPAMACRRVRQPLQPCCALLASACPCSGLAAPLPGHQSFPCFHPAPPRLPCQAALRAAPRSGGSGGGGEEHIVRTRTYDLLITYDKYYSVSGPEARREAGPKGQMGEVWGAPDRAVWARRWAACIVRAAARLYRAPAPDACAAWLAWGTG